MDKEKIRQLPREERIDVLRRQYFAKVLEPWVAEHPQPNEPVLF